MTDNYITLARVASLQTELLNAAIVGGGVFGIYSAGRLMHCDASTSEILRD